MSRVGLTLAAVVAVLAGFAGTVLIVPKPAHSAASPSPSGLAFATPSPGTSAKPSASGSARPTVPTPSPEGSAAPPTGAPPTGPGGPNANVVTFVNLQLDDSGAAGSQPRTFTFTSNGKSLAGFRITQVSGGSVDICLKPDTGAPSCHTVDGPAPLFLTPKASTVNWTATLIGAAGSQPVVDVEFRFVATNPVLILSHGRFDGTTWPNFNGVEAQVGTRKAGTLTISAGWGGHPFDYDIAYRDLASGTPTSGPGNSTGVLKTFPVEAGHRYGVSLHNLEAGFGPTDLTFKILWP